MPQYGQFNPELAENPSTLFQFQEVPVTSVKLNRWNGNINAGFYLLHQALSALLSKQSPVVISTGSTDGLQVTPAEPAAMKVQINPGWAIWGEGFTGVDSLLVRPLGDGVTAPTANPRIDLVYLSNEGAVEILTGTEAAQPSAPSVPANAIALSQLYLRPDSAQILASDNGFESYIIDQRPPLLMGEAHLHQPDQSPPEAPDGSRKNFSTEYHFRPGMLDVYLNGVLQTPGEDFHENEDARGYTFSTAPLSHYRVQHRYIRGHHNA